MVIFIEIFPVVHIINGNVDKAVCQGDLAIKNNADGVFFIDHENAFINTKPLYDSCNQLKSEYPDKFVGLNILGLSPINATLEIGYAQDRQHNNLWLPPDGLWVDNMRSDAFPETAMDYLNERRELDDPRFRLLKLIGGVAFKYTMEFTEDPYLAQMQAIDLMETVDIIVTSGSATGMAPSVEKLSAMKSAIADKLLAVASGISYENMERYAGIVDQILISTSVETFPKSGIFEPIILKKTIEKAHSL